MLPLRFVFRTSKDVSTMLFFRTPHLRNDLVYRRERIFFRRNRKFYLSLSSINWWFSSHWLTLEPYNVNVSQWKFFRTSRTIYESEETLVSRSLVTSILCTMSILCVNYVWIETGVVDRIRRGDGNSGSNRAVTESMTAYDHRILVTSLASLELKFRR